MSLAAAGALALAAVLDTAVGEPPVRVHPVAWLGWGVNALDARLPDTGWVGGVIAVCIPIGFGLTLAGGVYVAAAIGAAVASDAVQTGLALAAASGACFTCSSRRMLLAVAADVIERSERDLASARSRLRALAGRDASELSSAHVRSAAVESAAENLADGWIAPVLAFGLAAGIASLVHATPVVGLAAGAGAAGWVKGVNTLDSMLGYRHRGAGWAPARLDDAVMWVPARVTAVLLVVAGTHGQGRFRAAAATLQRVRPVAARPGSPNAGWPMASLAAVLGCGLEKPDVYALFPRRPLPTASTARVGLKTVSRAGVIGVCVVGAGLAGIAAVTAV